MIWDQENTRLFAHSQKQFGEKKKMLKAMDIILLIMKLKMSLIGLCCFTCLDCAAQESITNQSQMICLVLFMVHMVLATSG